MAKLTASEMPGGGKVMTAKSEHRRPPKKHVRAIHVTRGKSGGHVVEHHFENNDGQFEQPAQHVFGKDDGVQAAGHIIRHAGLKGVKAVAEGSPEEEAGESPAEEAGEGED